MGSLGRDLVLVFTFVNLMLCFYVGIQLFRTADFLQNAMNKLKVLTLGVLDVPDFSELKMLAVYVVLLGISAFAIAYWVDVDSSNIQKLMGTRKYKAKLTKQKKPEETKLGQIELLECPECGEELSPDYELCPNCGYELKLIACPKCGKEISRTFSLCPFCGTKLKTD